MKATIALAIGLIGTLSGSSAHSAGASTGAVSRVVADAPAGVPYDPPPGVQPFFPASPFLQQLPASPNVMSNSASMLSYFQSCCGNQSFGFRPVRVFASLPNTKEIAFPMYLNHSGSNTPVTIDCTVRYGGKPCNVQGMTVYVDDREIPQGQKDGHWILIDPAAGYEYVLYQTQWPPANGVLTASYGGRCALSGNGFTNPSYSGPAWNAGCNGDASSAPLSIGTVRAKDWLSALATNGVLPGALSYAAACNGVSAVTGGKMPKPFPPTHGDGCLGQGQAPAEGSRIFLALHDAAVNALNVPALSKVLLRTLDEDHYGAIMVDTGGNGYSGLGVNVESDSTYEAWGQPGPWLNAWLPEARAEALPGATSPHTGGGGQLWEVQIPVTGVNWSDVRVCADPSCA
jgi:hypothetical protein